MRIFIGWDSRFPEPAQVLAYSLRRRASIPLHIGYLDYAHLQRCYGFNRLHDPLASTEFTYSRFLVPWLCGYAGRALFLDNDMLCLADIAELDRLPMDGLALRVVKHNHQPEDGSRKMYGAVQTSYPRKNWSSLMLMDCAKLTLWTKWAVEHATGAYLHRFQDIADSLIGDVDPAWNQLDTWTEATKLLHWTSGGPWFEDYRHCDRADLWFAERALAEKAGYLSTA